MTVNPAIAERLTRKLYQLAVPILPDKREIMGKGIAVPQISLLHEQLQTIGALGARAPPYGTLSRSVPNHLRGAPDHFSLLLFRQIPGALMMISVPGNLVPFLDDSLDRFRIPLGNAAADHKGCLDFVLR